VQRVNKKEERKTRENKRIASAPQGSKMKKLRERKQKKKETGE